MFRARFFQRVISSAFVLSTAFPASSDKKATQSPPSMVEHLLKFHPRTHTEESLYTWAKESTVDFQKLAYSPANLALQIALLRLLGVKEISLNDLAKNKGGRSSFIRNLDTYLRKEDLTEEPLFTITAEDIFSSIVEFNRPSFDKKIPSLYSAVRNPVDHILPSLEQDLAAYFGTEHHLIVLQESMATLNDGDIKKLAHHEWGTALTKEQQNLLEFRLQLAKAACIKAMERYSLK